jgi:hypothetical protein
MKNAIVVAALGLLAFFAYTRAVGPRSAESPQSPAAEFEDGSAPLPTEAKDQFGCDGRTRCSQMNSCEEAEYFLRYCPGVEMDGDNDGEPCESQWCGNSR